MSGCSFDSQTLFQYSGLTLQAGVYCSASGKMTISAATVTLDGRNDPNAQWIFQTSTSVITSTATSFVLQNGAQAKNVFWSVGTQPRLSSLDT